MCVQLTWIQIEFKIPDTSNSPHQLGKRQNSMCNPKTVFSKISSRDRATSILLRSRTLHSKETYHSLFGLDKYRAGPSTANGTMSGWREIWQFSSTVSNFHRLHQHLQRTRRRLRYYGSQLHCMESSLLLPSLWLPAAAANLNQQKQQQQALFPFNLWLQLLLVLAGS
jgi:hypothetical protein